MNSLSSGSTTRPSSAKRSDCLTISSKSRSDSGSFQPAIRTATNATPPIKTAATITPSAMSSKALTAPTELKPWPSTKTTKPSDIATSAASPTRRSWLCSCAGLRIRILTSPKSWLWTAQLHHDKACPTRASESQRPRLFRSRHAEQPAPHALIVRAVRAICFPMRPAIRFVPARRQIQRDRVAAARPIEHERLREHDHVVNRDVLRDRVARRIGEVVEAERHRFAAEADRVVRKLHHHRVRFLGDRRTIPNSRGGGDDGHVLIGAKRLVRRRQLVLACVDRAFAHRQRRTPRASLDRARVTARILKWPKAQRHVARVRDHDLVAHDFPARAEHQARRELALLARRLQLLDREASFRQAADAC